MKNLVTVAVVRHKNRDCGAGSRDTILRARRGRLKGHIEYHHRTPLSLAVCGGHEVVFRLRTMNTEPQVVLPKQQLFCYYTV